MVGDPAQYVDVEAQELVQYRDFQHAQRPARHADQQGEHQGEGHELQRREEALDQQDLDDIQMPH